MGAGAAAEAQAPLAAFPWVTTAGFRQFALLLVGLAAYIAAGKFGLAHAIVNRSASAVWLPSGIALGLTLLLGARALAVVWIGAAIVNFTTAGTALTAALIATGNTAEAAVAAWLLQRWCAPAVPLSRPQDLLVFVPVMLIASAIAATVGALSLELSHLVPGALTPVWTTWWLGDALGGIIAAPPIVFWLTIRGPPRRVGESLLMYGTALLLAAFAVSGMVPSATVTPALGIVCLPPILWAGLRLGPREAATATLVLMAVLWYGPIHGPRWALVAPMDPNDAILLLQALIAITTLTGLTVAAVVAERERLEAALAQRAQALARSNADLERFAAVASHDLKEPLRMIRIYQQLVERRTHGQLPPEAVQALASAGTHAERMLQMVDGVLAMAQATSIPPRPQRVAVGEVLTRVLELFAERIRTSGAQIAIDPLPEVWCDPEHLAQVLQNVIANALKFSVDTPRLHLSAQAQPGAWTVIVRDHGIGIDPSERDRLFGMFQRSANARAFPGTGIGLATCRRLLEGMGGSITLEGAPGGGTAVHLRLPAVGSAR